MAGQHSPKYFRNPTGERPEGQDTARSDEAAKQAAARVNDVFASAAVVFIAVWVVGAIVIAVQFKIGFKIAFIIAMICTTALMWLVIAIWKWWTARASRAEKEIVSRLPDA